jgi:uncharacterized coiled-coil DUF342 family protein
LGIELSEVNTKIDELESENRGHKELIEQMISEEKELRKKIEELSSKLWHEPNCKYYYYGRGCDCNLRNIQEKIKELFSE